ncbi:mitochondrial inner membrane protease ATP23 homolog [Eurytemora carolleeae]|uniref:mitochondrial inner membrane protease ATP23 homolog n=1 Tax=Eurytemora carolleeae TaxID=1294199 RepID=UPI000C7632DD|nr:mitochondrial inner membrane protease ATP23 homolog [Eurytemora carolleeae]|eukprot:XP_023329471.1 mitochondrial inner membrane protease ATP23 homolog [Eurytemora affinis]
MYNLYNKVSTVSDRMPFSDLYPERRGGVINPSVLQRATGAGHPASLRVACERNVIENIEKMPMVRHFLSALKASGCPFDLASQVSCEMCQKGSGLEHAGGYDEKLNQIFICQNNTTTPGQVHAALVRNLFYVFDRCVNKYDFNNPEHLACTEVRKANLANCGWLVFMQRDGASLGVKNQHANCVKITAIESLEKTRFMSRELAEKSVENVFDRCYKDLEPIGRRSKDKKDIIRAFEEKFLFGYH